MRCIELFAGAGGAAIGLERAGLQHAALCEWDRDACATLRAAGLGPVVEGDVRDLDAIAAVAGESCDVLWSSFPCQAFSVAGKRLGAADERNGWPWTVAAIDRFRPTWLLGENVRGLLIHRTGCTYRGGQEGLFSAPDPSVCPGCYFERVILPDLRARFAHVGWWLLDAADFGVPQHRRRVILWAGPRPLTEPAPTHGPGRALPWVSMGEALRLDAGEVYTQRSPDTAKGGNRWIPTDEPATTLSAAAQPQLRAVEVNRKPPRDVTDRPAPTIDSHTGISGDNYEQALRIVFADLLAQPSPTVPAQLSGPHGQDSWAYIPDSARLAQSSPTVPTVGEQNGRGPGGQPELMQRASDAPYLGTGRRRLTVAECARLQDFPADHPWQGGVGAQYRQVGNAVPPALAYAVGTTIIPHPV